MTYDIKPNTIVHGDCLTVLRQMPDNYIDMIITDPPYGIDYQSNRPKSKNPSAKFAKIANDKNPFIWWIYDAFRVLKDGGGCLCFSRWDVQQIFIDALQLAGFTVKSVLIWDREIHGMGDLKGNFAPRYDTCIFATKGRYLLPGKRPTDVIRCQRLNGTELVHPNEKPVALMRELIEDTTTLGALILDPFAGSGSVLTAAALTGRQYIGIEISEEHHVVAQRRALEAMKTFLLGGAAI